MLLANLLFSFMDMELKVLSARYPAMQVAALRGLTSLPLVFVYVVWRRALPGLLKVRWPLHVLRGVLAIAMLVLYSYALRTLSLSAAFAICFVAPLIIAALSAPVLKEKVDAGRWRAIVIGFIGVLVILRPGFNHTFALAGFAALGTALFYAFNALTVRFVAKTDSIESMVFWFAVLLSIGAGALALPDWVHLRTEDTPDLIGLATTGFAAQILITYGYQHGEASAVAPFDYTALVWCAAIDWVVWQTFPDGYTLAGAAVIVAAGIYLVRRETTAADSEHP
ncbi:MAG: DMT family transporter [Burkholderiaceae bacterium]|nr:DMT family transporter [Burkholderiaceae bacterium]